MGGDLAPTSHKEFELRLRAPAMRDDHYTVIVFRFRGLDY